MKSQLIGVEEQIIAAGVILFIIYQQIKGIDFSNWIYWVMISSLVLIASAGIIWILYTSHKAREKKDLEIDKSLSNIERIADPKERLEKFEEFADKNPKLRYLVNGSIKKAKDEIERNRLYLIKMEKYEKERNIEEARNEKLKQIEKERNEKEQREEEARIASMPAVIKTEEDKKEIPAKDKKLVSKIFDHSSELSFKEKNNLIFNYGYRPRRFIFINGKPGNNLVIKKEGNELDYHFCTKHLFAEVDKKHSKIEYSINSLRADVAFIYKKKKIAVEIETGSNNEEQIQSKVDWLKNNFNFWILVCSRNNKSKYKKFVDSKKSFCLTLNEAYKKLQQLIS